MEYSEFEAKARTMLSQNSEYLQLMNGNWKVCHKEELLNQCKNKLFDDSIGKLLEAVESILRQKSKCVASKMPYFIPVSGEYDNSLELRGNLVKSLCWVKKNLSELSQCNQEKIENNIYTLVSTLLQDAKWITYEPIDPQKEYLPKDVSRRVDNSVFWNELFNQLRRQLLGNYFILYFNVLCYGAKWFYQKENGKTSIVDLSGLKVMLENLFLKDWNIQDRDFETPRLLPYILRAVIVLATNENDDKTKEVVFDICERIFADNPVNSFFETGIFFYRNNPKRIQEWYDDWLSENGKLWQEPLYDRNAILKRFIDAKKIYDLNNDIYMELALTKSSWSVIGYVSHKEYSGDFLLNWYNALVDLDEANIHRFAREIKDISDKIELLGDNRMRHHIDSKIFSDVFSEGIKDIISFLKNEYYFSQAMKSPYYLVDGLTGYLRKNNPNREQLLLIWTTGMVLLDWRLEDNHSSIAALQKAIEICALRKFRWDW